MLDDGTEFVSVFVLASPLFLVDRTVMGSCFSRLCWSTLRLDDCGPIDGVDGGVEVEMGTGDKIGAEARVEIGIDGASGLEMEVGIRAGVRAGVATDEEVGVTVAKESGAVSP